MAHNEVGGQHRGGVRGGVRGCAGFDLAQQKFGARRPNLVQRNRHTGELRNRVFAHFSAVKANHADIFGHTQTGLLKRAHYAYGKIVVLHQNRGAARVLPVVFEPMVHSGFALFL